MIATALRSIPSAALALTVGLACGMLAGCATNPVTGKKQLSFVSENRELQIGRESDPAILAEYGLYADERVQRYVDSVGQRLARVSHLPSLTWHFRVLDSPVVNAFALPGGYVYITRGILAYIGSEAQLAGVLGHEIGHVTARHGAQQITQSNLYMAGLLAGAIFVESFRPYTGLAQQGLGILLLKYSRDHETQADELGIEYSVKAGYDPRDVPATYSVLKRIGEKSGARLPYFLSTHPDPGDREIRTTQLAKAAAASARRELSVGAAAYRDRAEGLVFGDDPRAGYFDGNRFYHPDLAFEMILPAGWTYQNEPAQLLAVHEPSGAAMQLTLQTSSDSTLQVSGLLDSLRLGGAITSASGRRERLRDHDAWLGTVIASGAGGSKELLAGFVHLGPGRFLQILGQAGSATSSAAEQIYQSIRSVAALRDRAKLAVTPDRLSIRAAKRSGAFSGVWSEYPNQAITLEDATILNNTRATASIAAGAPIKIVPRGQRG